MSTELEALKAEVRELIAALDSKEAASVWAFYYAHGMTYSGPRYDRMDKLREMVDAS